MYTERASDKLDDLIGKGIEYLLDKNGEVIAIFIDGMINGQLYNDECNEKTIILIVKEFI